MRFRKTILTNLPKAGISLYKHKKTVYPKMNGQTVDKVPKRALFFAKKRRKSGGIWYN